jgi:hypothetical protein
MTDSLITVHEEQILVCAPDGEKLASEADAVELIGRATNHGAGWVLLPVERFNEDFFRLKTGILGHFVQKFVTYRQRLVILGNISQYKNESRAFKDFVYETNRGSQLWFVADLPELEEKIKAGK